MEEARAGDDANGVRSASVALARWLASRDRDLDEAVELAASVVDSIEAGEDVDLRRELSAWLESLGEPGRAAAMLRPVASLPWLGAAEAAWALTRTGLLKARAGAAMGAAAAFESALSLHVSNPLPCELLGALGGWATDAVSPSAASAAYVEAARRRGALGQHDEALDDLWRAMAADPTSEASARALCEALQGGGHAAQGQEVLRRHARTVSRAGVDLLTVASSTTLRGMVFDVAAQRDVLADLPHRTDEGQRESPADAMSLEEAATLADSAAAASPDRAAVAALERAVDVVGPRPEWCRALSEMLSALGENDAAFECSQRYVLLRAGERDGLDLLFRVIEKGGGGAQPLTEALAWLLAQPLPADWLAGPFAMAVAKLARLDQDRAALMARRALDVLGARSAPLRRAMLEVADQASDDGFSATVLERWLSCGAVGLDRREALCHLIERRERLGDEEGRARTLARALLEDVRSPELARHVDPRDVPSPTGDAELWRLKAKAEWLFSSEDHEPAAHAWRNLGAALWDLADDRMGAIDAWHRAARIAPSRGHAHFALDLVTFGGGEFAFEYFARLIASEPVAGVAASIAAAAAEAALSIGDSRLAFDLAARGVSRCPASGHALGIAERASARSGENAALSGLYDLVGIRALGRFGRRAAHYRGARLFDGRGQYGLALEHAAEAFEAVPSAGHSLRLLSRSAALAGDVARAVAALENVARREPHGKARARWLLEAAAISDDGEDGAQRRFGLLLRAALESPCAATVGLLREAAQSFLRLCPDERDAIELRLDHAAGVIVHRVDGQAGARVAIAFAITALDLLGNLDAALTLVERAFECDPGVSEFDQLVGRAAELRRAARCAERTAAMVASVDQSRGRAGLPALRMLMNMASEVGAEALRVRAVVAAAASNPDEDDLVVDADEAVRSFPELSPLMASGVTPVRRAEALAAVARRRVAQGAYSEAAALFERTLDLVHGETRAALERELLSLWDKSGYSGDIEARVQREAAREETPPGTRADRWAQIARRREARGDKTGAVQALLEACNVDAWSLERWSALERVSEIAGDDQTRIMALEHIAASVADEGRVAVFKRLAHVHARRDDRDATEQTWRRVLAFDPEDEEADHALEAAIISRGRYEDLADHLARRVQRLRARSGSRDELRALRLRRAAILEQRLGRIEDACEELERLLADWPENAAATRYLADLLDRRGECARSAPLWRRAATAEPDAAPRDHLDMRAARAAYAAGDHDEGARDVRRVLSRNPSNPEALELAGQLLRAIRVEKRPDESPGSESEASARSERHLESALAAAKSGDLSVALGEAKLAADAAATRATPRLLACAFEYRLRGAGTADDARRTIGELTRIGERLGHDDDALRTFLLAEALDVVQGRGAGLHELEVARAVVGDHALLAVGVAERLAAQGQHGPAVDAYRVALSGPLFELRKPVAVAIAAAESEIRAGSSTLEREATERMAPSSSAPPPDSRLRDLELWVRAAATPRERAGARLALAGARLERGDPSGAEPLLWEALADGLSEAGDMLAPMLASLPERTRDLVRLRRQQAVLEPGDVERLESLRAAAQADEDEVYAEAVDHVLRALDPDAEPLPPPPLASQHEQPGLLPLLVRPSMDPAGETYALLWEGATQLFAREAGHYGVSGVERVVPGPSSAVARLYESARRVLDAPRIPLFAVRRSGGVLEYRVALLASPSVVLAGDLREDSAELRFALGRGMAAALPQNALRLGLAPDEGKSLIDALRTAFGPSQVARRVESGAARLAQSFWQVMPPRVQRRLQEILAATPLAGYDDLVDRARQSELRVGLFLSGDFACAARAAVGAAGGGDDPLRSLAALRSACERLPGLADLLSLAISPEYAEARWRASGPATPRGPRSSGRIRLF